jgi:WhiB family redox-sensing transcriptional regulator
VNRHPSLDSWQHKGACLGPQSAVFFPPPQFERKVERLERERRAKMICQDCPVQASCLEYAIDIREPHGIWGGLNEGERRTLLEERDGVLV